MPWTDITLNDGADYTERPLPFRLGFGCTDDLITVADRSNASFSIDFTRTPFLAAIGRVPVGLLADNLTLIHWPRVGESDTEARLVQSLHRLADSDARGLCYFIGGETGPVKIGFSVDVASRLRAIQTHSPIPLSILATRAGGAAREGAYHRQFAEHRLHGEWFERTPELLAEIARLCEVKA